MCTLTAYLPTYVVTMVSHLMNARYISVHSTKMLVYGLNKTPHFFEEEAQL